MTSTAPQPTNPSAHQQPSVPSYASAAGANKKPASSPLIASGTNNTAAVAANTSSASSAQNGKPVSASPVNGQTSSAVPINQASANGSHTRNKSMQPPIVIGSGNPIVNGGPVGGSSKPLIQFGSPGLGNSSPAVQHIASPAQSPSPIPVPQATGGRPNTSGAPPVSMTFGSFPGESHMKNVSMPGQPPAHGHVRRDSQASAHGDMINHGGQGPNRGGFGQGGGRGGPRTFTPGQNFQQPNMGYPPPNQRYNGANAGRGGMQYQQNRPYPNSPQPGRANMNSPAQAPAVPHQGTPTMQQAVPMMSHVAQPFYPNQQPFYPQQHVMPPFLSGQLPSASATTMTTSAKHFNNGGKKKKGVRRDFSEPAQHSSNPGQYGSSFNNAAFKTNNKTFTHNDARRSSTHSSNREEPRWERKPDMGGLPFPQQCPGARAPSYDYIPLRPAPLFQPMTGRYDLSTPEKYEEAKKLTERKQMGQMPMYPNTMYGGYPNQMQQQQQWYQPQPGAAPYQPQYPPYGQGAPVAQPMSRNNSQVSEHRPASSTGPPAIVSSTPQQRAAQPATTASPAAVRPKRAAIVIKAPDGTVVDLKKVNQAAPASPGPSIQQSRTPPAVVSSSPAPPSKPATPSTPTHARTDSTAASKSTEEIRAEFMRRIKETQNQKQEAEDAKASAAGADKAASDKADEEDKAKKAEEERIKEEERVAADKKKADDEAKAKEQADAESKAKADAEAKENADAEAKSKAEEEAKAKAQAEKDAEAKPEKADAPREETEDERIDREIAEMEEADRLREEKQAEITARKNAEKEEAKKKAEANKVTDAAEADRKLREQEREMERLEEEKERKRAERENGASTSVADLLTKKIEDLKLSDKKDTPASVADKLSNLSISGSDSSAAKSGATDKARTKPAALNLVVPSKPIEPPQPSAALQSLKSARYLEVRELSDLKLYPEGIASPNPALNSAVARKNKSFKYDANFLLQFQKVFTEQPSLEFTAQVKSLIGDGDSGRSASTRGSAGPGTRSGSKAGASGGFPSQGAMGQFASGGKTLPPGTTSAERFAMAQSGASSRPGMGNPMASFGGRGGFGGGNQMSRTPSSSQMGGMPNSPRQGSRRGGGSKRNDFSGRDNNAAKNMPLTAGQELKPIEVTASGWKPTSIGKAPVAPSAIIAQGGHMDPEMVQRKVKAALNKMTPEKFDRIADQILTIAAQSKDEQDGRTLRQVIQLTFEKACDEAHWASMYAKFCHKMLTSIDPEIRDDNIKDKSGNLVTGGALFRKYLLNRCQEEFERGWKVDLPEAPSEKEGEKKTAEAALLSDEYYIAAAAKRRGLGLVQFIGELYKLAMLTERIMHECLRKLLEFDSMPDEAEIESLTKLLRTVGYNLDNTEKPGSKQAMDAYFARIQSIIDMPELPSRLKFMLMDIMDLRKKGWVSKDSNKGPKTLDEIKAEAEAAQAQKAADSARNNTRGGPGGRPQAGRGDSRNFSYQQPVSNQVGLDDLRKLKGASSRVPSATASFGPTSMFQSRSNSGRNPRLGPSFGRAGEDSGASSRAGTPPTSIGHANAFSILAQEEHPASPPSTNASPALPKANLANDEKKE